MYHTFKHNNQTIRFSDSDIADFVQNPVNTHNLFMASREYVLQNPTGPSGFSVFDREEILEISNIPLSEIESKFEYSMTSLLQTAIHNND